MNTISVWLAVLVWRQVDHLQQTILYLQIGNKGKEKKAAADFKAALKALQSSGKPWLLVCKGALFTFDEIHAKCLKILCGVHLWKYATSHRIALALHAAHNQTYASGNEPRTHSFVCFAVAEKNSDAAKSQFVDAAQALELWSDLTGLAATLQGL